MQSFKKEFAVFLSILAFATPALAFAQQLTQLQQLVSSIAGIVTILIPLLMALALVAFFWGLVRFIFSAGGNEKAKEEGKRLMIWGGLALFVMAAIWGIIVFVAGNLGIGIGGTPRVPTYPTSG